MNHLKTSFTGLLMALAVPAYASVTATENLGTNSWVGTPTITVASPPSAVTFPTGENNYSANSLISLSQSFTVSSSGTLDNIQLILSGNSMTNTIGLYDLGVSNPTSYTPGSGATSANLFSSGLSFIYAASGAASVLELQFSGVDNVALSAGHVYAFEVDPTATGVMTWYRGQDVYAGGSAFRGESLLNGVQRDMSLAVNIVPVPEPTSVALMGGALAMLGMYRRFKK